MAVNTPKLSGLGDAFAKLIARVEGKADNLHKRMENVADHGENSIDKFSHAVTYVEGVVSEVEDAANQMMGGNGGPPMGNSDTSSAGPKPA
jgi:hypothetical protein